MVISGCLSVDSSVLETQPESITNGELEVTLTGVRWIHLQQPQFNGTWYKIELSIGGANQGFDYTSRNVHAVGVANRSTPDELHVQLLGTSSGTNVRQLYAGASGIGGLEISQHGELMDEVPNSEGGGYHITSSYSWRPDELEDLGITAPLNHWFAIFAGTREIEGTITWEGMEPELQWGTQLQEIHIDQFSGANIQAGAVVGAGGEWRGSLATNDTIPIIFFDPPDTDFTETLPRRGAYYYEPEGRRQLLGTSRGAMVSSPLMDEWIFGFDGALDPYRPNWPILSIAHIPAETGK